VFLDVFFDSGGTRGSWEIFDNKGSEDQVFIRIRLTWDASCWAVDESLSVSIHRSMDIAQIRQNTATDPLVVNDFYNRGCLASIRPGLE
jgi:hypothetical protein